MRYFISNVTTYATAGKTKRGAMLQAVAKQFEHCILANEKALAMLYSELERAVDVANRVFKRNPLKLEISPDSGCICVKPESNCNSSYVFVISYVHINGELFNSNVYAMFLNCKEYRAVSRLDWK